MRGQQAALRPYRVIKNAYRATANVLQRSAVVPVLVHPSRAGHELARVTEKHTSPRQLAPVIGVSPEPVHQHNRRALGALLYVVCLVLLAVMLPVPVVPALRPEGALARYAGQVRRPVQARR